MTSKTRFTPEKAARLLAELKDISETESDVDGDLEGQDEENIIVSAAERSDCSSETSEDSVYSEGGENDEPQAGPSGNTRRTKTGISEKGGGDQALPRGRQQKRAVASSQIPEQPKKSRSGSPASAAPVAAPKQTTRHAKGALAEKSTGPQQVSSRHSRRDVSAPPENEVLLAGDQVPEQDQAQTSDRGKLKVGSILRGKDGTEWRVIKTGDETTGRKGSHNVLKDVPDPSPHAKRNVDDTARSAWGLFFTDSMLKRIQLCTETEARKSGNKEWSISVEELEAFIATLYARGAYGLASRDRDYLWSRIWGPKFFSLTMARDRFREIMRYLRFDIRSDRSQRLQTDKFALVSDIWNPFVENCLASYRPGPNLTVDEQLFPTKTRCPFTQYMPNKPDKFGIKFWMLADSSSKYMCNAMPYLGKDDSRSANDTLASHVVMKLAEPYLNKGRNVTTDNFFTTCELAKKLQTRKTSLVGTVNRIRREIPQEIKKMKEELYSTSVLENDGNVLVVYQGKRSKNVLLLSTMHSGMRISSGEKKLPEPIMFYNKTKAGVDVVDQMARLYSTRAATRRWPVHVFYNILDLAGLNAFIVYKECTKSSLRRHEFILKLCTELSGKQDIFHLPGNDGADEGQGQLEQAEQSSSRRKCNVRKHCKGNHTSKKCVECNVGFVASVSVPISSIV